MHPEHCTAILFYVGTIGILLFTNRLCVPYIPTPLSSETHLFVNSHARPYSFLTEFHPFPFQHSISAPVTILPASHLHVSPITSSLHV
jgi:hypothetical protein